MTLRHLIVVLGDQLNDTSAAFDGFDSNHDAVWMCEAPAEATVVWNHKARIAIFLSAMRHFCDRLRGRGISVRYLASGEHSYATLAEALSAEIAETQPQKVILVQPGEWRLVQDFVRVAEQSGVAFETREDQHFWLPLADFEVWMQGRKQPRMEHFYRWMRQRTGVLMDDKKPVGGEWNYDHENRESFGAEAPKNIPARLRFSPDATTQKVLDLVAQRYSEHPGELAEFDWPVTREGALKTLEHFVSQRLAGFGPWQDAMWVGEPWLWHSHLSAALNLKLLNPREVCQAAEDAWRSGKAPIASVEGFIRQILGWREFVRGLYWHRMPAYLDDNALDAQQPLPAFYWTAETDYACLRDAISQTLKFGYANHIQRLMITGLFSLLLGVRPREIHAWYLAVYVDAVEWVELPNVLGMSQFADGGFMASKPYIASGKYISRMSNACAGCRYDPELVTGPKACPFTTLYWDFLDRHEARFQNHPRLKLQVNNLLRKGDEQRVALRDAAAKLRASLLPARR